MKKLGKNLQPQLENVEAYACVCVCSCYAPCWCSTCQPYSSSAYGNTQYWNGQSLKNSEYSSRNYNNDSAYY